MSTEGTTPETEHVDPSGREDREFHCPYCGAAYSHEYLTRVHITRCDDTSHQTRDGLMPETPVERVSAAGETIRIKRSPEEIDISTLDLSDLPDRLTTRQKRIILTAAYNPYVANYTELHERVQGVFKERDLDDVSYDTVRRTVQNFFRPTDDETSSATEEQYDELTEKQQRVIDTYIANPSLTYAEIAEEANTSHSYPGQILDKYETLVAELQDAVESQEATSKAESSASETESDSPETTDASPSESPETEESETDTRTNDGPANTPEVFAMSAGPYDDPLSIEGKYGDSQLQNGSEPIEGDQDGEMADEEAETGTSERQIDDETQPDGATGSDQLLLERVAELHEQVRFLQRIAKRQLEIDESATAATQLAIADEIETQLEQILERQG